ncbi:MAG: hypothetical protein ACTS27_05020 [Phycisphaerales bacterium]
MIKHAVIRRPSPRTLGAGLLAAGLLASSAWAELPSSLDRVPTDALAVVVAPSVDRLDKNAAALLTALEMPAVTSPAQLLSVVGLSRGIDTGKPVALALMAGDLGGDVPPALLLLPVSDYAAVARSLSADNEGGDLATGLAAGEQIYIKQIPGGYAAVSPVRSVLEKYTGDGGMLGAHRTNLGAMGVSVVENADAALIANIPALRPLIEPGIEQIKQNALPFMNQGGFGPDMMENSPFEQIAENFLRDAKVGVLGLKASGMGLTTTLAANFTEGSELAQIFQGGGDSARLLSKLPQGTDASPAMLAYAIDLTSPVARTMISRAKELQDAGMAAGQQASPAMPGATALLDNLTGQSGVIMKNPAGLTGGLLARGTFYYESSSPDAVLQGYETLLNDLDGESANGLNYSATYKADTTTIGDRKVSAYSLRAQARPGSMAGGMGMIYGPTGGPSGFLGKVDKGVVATTTPDQSLMTGALDAAGGKNSLAGDRMLSQVQRNLPEKRVFEAYIMPRSILDQALPFLAMMGQPIDANAIPQALPPIGASMSADGGAMRFDVFVPAPVIKAGVAVGQSLQDMIPQNGAGNGAGNNPPF